MIAYMDTGTSSSSFYLYDDTTAAADSISRLSKDRQCDILRYNGIIDSAWIAYQRWLDSRNWTEAPLVIKPVCNIFGKRFLWNRFIGREWTGKNFRKVL